MSDAGMFGNIMKGPVHAKIDALVNDPDVNKRQRFLADLKDWTLDYVNIIQEHAGVTDAEALYLRNSWYNLDPATGWWPEHQPIEPIVRQGLITAIEVAMQDPDTGVYRNLPLDSYWISGRDDQLEVIVTWNSHQVTRLILTPMSPLPSTPNPLPAEAHIYVVKRNREAVPVGHRSREEVVERTEERGRVYLAITRRLTRR